MPVFKTSLEDEKSIEFERICLKGYKFVANNYIVAHSSISQYFLYEKVPTRRKIIAWSSLVCSWITAIIFTICSIYHDQNLWLMFGIPFYCIRTGHLMLISFNVAFIFGAFSRTICLVVEHQHKIEFLYIIQRLLHQRGKLTNKYFKKFYFLVDLIVNYCVIAFYLIEIYDCILFSSLSIYTLTTRQFDCKLEMLWVGFKLLVGTLTFGGLASWLTLNVCYAGFLAFFLSVNYLTFRFEQVRIESWSCTQD
jgi:hypothetical protein